MKKEELIKKIEDQAKIFKSRKNVGQSDGKRHDTIQLDEEQMMWVAHKQLGWSNAKIATVFDRGDVTVAKRMQRLEKKFTKNKAEPKQGERSLRQKQQIEHIKLLQELARRAVDSVQLFFPDFEHSYDSDLFNEFNYNIVSVVRRLVVNHDWKDLAAHLGEEGIEIETISRQLDDLPPNPDRNYEQILDKIWFLIKHKGLKTIADNSDTRIWEYKGLNQKCMNCPDQSLKL